MKKTNLVLASMLCTTALMAQYPI
ncbi:MAG: hypothetical protein RIS29_815, partial [Bacteroidota bacterium]